MAEAACTTLRIIQHFHFLPCSLFVACYYHLRNAFSVFYHESLRRKIYKDNANLSTIIGINRSRRVQYRDTFLNSQTTARAHLCLKPRWQGNI